MADRFASFRTPDQLRAVFGIAGAVPNWPPSWNIGPGDTAPAICRSDDGRSLRLLRWGFVRAAMRGELGDRAPPHARAETVTSSHLFGASFRDNRCLVPADAFYGRPPAGEERAPVAHARMDGRPAALGGIWSGEDGDETTGSFAILTLEARTIIAGQDRMPVLIEEIDWATWLGETDDDVEFLLRAAGPYVLRSWPVGPGFEDPDRDGPDLLAPVD